MCAGAQQGFFSSWDNSDVYALVLLWSSLAEICQWAEYRSSSRRCRGVTRLLTLRRNSVRRERAQRCSDSNLAFYGIDRPLMSIKCFANHLSAQGW